MPTVDDRDPKNPVHPVYPISSQSCPEAYINGRRVSIDRCVSML